MDEVAEGIHMKYIRFFFNDFPGAYLVLVVVAVLIAGLTNVLFGWFDFS